jgi:hypothetical protein
MYGDPIAASSSFQPMKVLWPPTGKSYYC